MIVKTLIGLVVVLGRQGLLLHKLIILHHFLDQESIAGACNVVCVSKDYRNPQPSAEELNAADFVFYRTFDVQSCTISDKMDDKVGDLESMSYQIFFF